MHKGMSRMSRKVTLKSCDELETWTQFRDYTYPSDSQWGT